MSSFIEDGDLIIIMEYILGGDLSKFVNKRRINEQLLPETILWKYAHDLLNALDYLHSHRLVHRDIKCENIFCDKNGSLKVS